jgi:hypothetical protein
MKNETTRFSPFVLFSLIFIFNDKNRKRKKAYEKRKCRSILFRLIFIGERHEKKTNMYRVMTKNFIVQEVHLSLVGGKCLIDYSRY